MFEKDLDALNFNTVKICIERELYGSTPEHQFAYLSF